MSDPPSDFQGNSSRPRLKSGATALADLVESCIAPVIVKQGFDAADIIMYWPEIVGSRLAHVCEPLKLRWPPRPALGAVDAVPEPATLVVRVESAFALELQHLAPVVVARANAYLGWRGIDRIALRQGPSQRQPSPRKQRAAPAASARVRSADLAEGIADDALREALTRLGAFVLSDREG